ncbi:hypothetical protein [Streptomyces yangpuensis]|uniref:hypothetical protein n=1 Tax=Streptomyces yangpuensis TaxID=1648182 RepID=UPI0036B7410A
MAAGLPASRAAPAALPAAPSAPAGAASVNARDWDLMRGDPCPARLVLGLRDLGRVRQPGQRAPANGTSGGVENFAVQLAKAFGAEVTGVCGTGNTEPVRPFGTDHVVDHSREDFNRTGRRHGLVLVLDLDLVGDRTLAEYLRGTPEAIRYPEVEHGRAKVVITA